MPGENGKRLRVEVWTDLICPWCGIGERRFNEALERFDHKDRVDVVLRAFRLMPGEAPRATLAVLEGKYGLSRRESEEAIARLEGTAAGAGLVYSLAASLAGDTMDGHRLIKFAASGGLERRVYNRLFRAVMSEGENVYDPATLTRLAVECGLDGGEAAACLASRRYSEDVERDEAAMKRLGGRAVPFFLFNGRYDYAGALSSDIYLAALEKSWQEGAASGSGAAGGLACGPDGCVLPSGPSGLSGPSGSSGSS